MPSPERPVVTVEGGAAARTWGEDLPVDDLAAEPRSLSPVRRGLALLLAAAAGFGASEVLQAREDAAEARAQDGVLSLLLLEDSGGFATEVYADGRTRIVAQLRLTNTGPLPVTVTGVSLVGTPLEAALDLTLSPGASRRVRAQHEPACDGGPSRVRDDAGRTVQVRARTAAGDRTADLDLERPLGIEARDALDRACGYLPVGESVQLLTQSVAEDDDGTTVAFSLVNLSNAALRVAGFLASTPGFVVEPVTALPLDLPPTPPGRPQGELGPEGLPGTVLELRVRIPEGGCAVAASALDGGAFPELAAVSVEDPRTGETAQSGLPDETAALRTLLGRACR